jgi:hypothetical protein
VLGITKIQLFKTLCGALARAVAILSHLQIFQFQGVPYEYLQTEKPVRVSLILFGGFPC